MKRNKKKKHKPKFEDDGRVIANMNVEGMPWYHPKAKNHDKSDSNQVELTGKEKRAMTRGVMLAALLVVGIFLVVFGLFILFCVFVWFA